MVTGLQPPQEPQREGQPLTPNLCGHKENPERSTTTTEKEKGVPKKITAGLLYSWRSKVRAVEITQPHQKEGESPRSPKESLLGCMTPFTSSFILTT